MSYYMAPQFSSIQSFFSASKPNIDPPNHVAVGEDVLKSGDGFTEAEVEAVIHPTVDENWLPSQEYEETEIASLIPGPHCVTFQGRVVNFYDQPTPSKRPRAAKGCVKIVVKDDTGAITVSVAFY
jgi:hypothetical protein